MTQEQIVARIEEINQRIEELAHLAASHERDNLQVELEELTKQVE